MLFPLTFNPLKRPLLFRFQYRLFYKKGESGNKPEIQSILNNNILSNPSKKYIVTYTPIARQHVSKRVPAKTFLIKSPLLDYATIEEAVIFMSSVPSNSRNTVLCNPFLSNGTVNTSTIIGVFHGVCAVLTREVNSDAKSVQGSYE
jgi:hypothetical protein